MNGKKIIEVYSKKSHYIVTLRRKITIINGNSGTGKTELLRLLASYESAAGYGSGVKVISDSVPFVVTSIPSTITWQDLIKPAEGRIIFIEENNRFVFQKEFADYATKSSSYFVIISRVGIKCLPYSIHEIYELREVDGVMRNVPRYPDELIASAVYQNTLFADKIITEDSNAGNEFFNGYFNGCITVESAGGNSNINNKVSGSHKSILAIADGAAFGAYIDELNALCIDDSGKHVTAWLPESFEYLILISGIVPIKLEAPEMVANDAAYASWEQYFTKLLTSSTKDSYLAYTKSAINKAYVNQKNMEKIAKGFPKIIQDFRARVLKKYNTENLCALDLFDGTR